MPVIQINEEKIRKDIRMAGWKIYGKEVESLGFLADIDVVSIPTLGSQRFHNVSFF